eukprot:403351157
MPILSFFTCLLSQSLLSHKFNFQTKRLSNTIQRLGAFMLTTGLVTVVIIFTFLAIENHQGEYHYILIFLLKLIPFISGFVTAQVFLIGLNWNLIQKDKKSMSLIARSLCGPILLLSQLTSSFYFAQFLAYSNTLVPTATPFICALYPQMIGRQKQLLFYLVRPFEMDEIYEFGSLAFAAMPYRFIYLELDTWGQASIVFAIKYIYKFIVYIASMKYKSQMKSNAIKRQRFYREKIFCWFQKKTLKKAIQIKMEDGIKQTLVLEKKRMKYYERAEQIFTDKKVLQYLHSQIDLIINLQQKHKLDQKPQEYYNLKSLFYSFKFYFLQLNDLCDLTTVLGLIFVLRKLGYGFFGSLTDDQFQTYALLSMVETVLEITYTVVTPLIIRNLSKYQHFYPSIAGNDQLKKQFLSFTSFIIFMFPLTIHNLTYEIGTLH